MKTSKYTKELLEPVVAQSTCYAQVIRALGLKVSGGSQAFIKDKITLLGIDTSHFTGQLWSKGLTKENHPAIKQQSDKIRLDPEEVLRPNTDHKGRTLKNALLALGAAYVCGVCNSEPVWMGKELKLHVDHINGNRMDNRRENLRFLCPNCHQQTPTWGNGPVEPS